MDGEIEVLPLEDETAYEAANPVSGAGTVEIDEKLMKARRDAIVKRLLERGPFAFIIVGGSHDLSENVQRLSNGKAEYIRVTTERYSGFAGETD